MRIIKEGKKFKTFTCEYCECVFEADNNEYQESLEYLEPDVIKVYECQCPCCNHNIEQREYTQ